MEDVLVKTLDYLWRSAAGSSSSKYRLHLRFIRFLVSMKTYFSREN